MCAHTSVVARNTHPADVFPGQSRAAAHYINSYHSDESGERARVRSSGEGAGRGQKGEGHGACFAR